MEKAIASAQTYTIGHIFNACKIKKPLDNKRIVALGAVAYLKRHLDSL